jgi:hypothetical protein
MSFQVNVNLHYSHLGYLFLFYYLLAYTPLLKYIKRGAIIYHRHSKNRIHHIIHGKNLYEDIYALDDVKKEEVEETKVEETKVEETKVEETPKFEDKYLEKFKQFSSDFFFNDDELLVKANKYIEFKAEWEANQKKIYYNIHSLLVETQKIIALGSIINEETREALVKYFEIEEDYKEDPSNIDFDELYIYIENDNKKFSSELELIEKIEWSSELDAEIQEKALNHVLELKLEGFINNYILESTPLGNVFMRYNNQKKSFEYYSNNTVPYRYLETIGRKYVMTFRCKSLFVDLEEELKKASDKKEQKASVKDLEKEHKSRFKSYNNDLKMDKNMMSVVRPGLPPQIKVNLPNVNGSNNEEKQLLKENANRYTWISRLSDFPMLKKVDRKTVDKNYAMSFADFKKSKEIKT